MKPKLFDVIDAVRTFARASRADDQMFVVNFNEKVMPGLNTMRLGNSSDALAHAISDTLATGQTALYDAVIEAFGQLRAGTVGIFDEDDADRNPDVLNRLARATGGEAFFPGQHNEVVEICESIARDIRNQYTIGYVSSNAVKAGAYRSIHVVAMAPGHSKLLVRARTGYIAGGEPK
jgi:VWFA-related protein